MNTTRATSSPSIPASTALTAPRRAPRRQVDNPSLSGAGHNSRGAAAMRRADAGSQGVKAGMIAYHELASALSATQPTQDRLRAAMLAAGHTIAGSGFDVTTPVHCLRAAQHGADMRHARITCTTCGEYVEIVVANGRVIHGDIDSTEQEIEEWRSGLGVVACGQIVSKPTITLRSLAVQKGVAQSICRSMDEAGHHMSAPTPARCPKFRGLIHSAVCQDCGAKIVVDGDLRIHYASLSASGEMIVGRTAPMCRTRAAAAGEQDAKATIEIARESDDSQISHIAGQEDF